PMTAQGLEECLGRGVELAGLARGPPTRLAPRAAGRDPPGGRRQQHHHRPLASAEADPARRHAATEQRQQPGLRVLLEVAERGHPGEAGALDPLVWLAVDQLDHGLQPEAVVEPGHSREGLADDQGDALAVPRLALGVEAAADVAPPAAVEGLRLVSEVAKNRVV